LVMLHGSLNTPDSIWFAETLMQAAL